MSKPSSRRKLVVTFVVVLVVVAAGIFLLTRPKKAATKPSTYALPGFLTSVAEAGKRSYGNVIEGVIGGVNVTNLPASCSGRKPA